MVKTIAASQGHEAEAEKSQNHFVHCPNGERTDNDNTLIDVFRWSRCKKPLPQKVMRSIGIPLPSEHVEVLSPAFLRSLKVNKYLFLFAFPMIFYFEDCWVFFL